MTDAGPSVLCITPSPAIDRTALVPRIRLGDVLRPTRVTALPGGKGVNVARAAARLGARVTTTGIAGGHAGRWIVEALTAEGLRPTFSFAAAETRTTYVTVDETGASVIVYERPAPITDGELDAFLALLAGGLLASADRATVSGSLAGPVASEAYGRIVDVAREAGTPLLVDASGESLDAALRAGPDLVKVSRDEVVEAGVVGAAADASTAAAALVERGARLAVVTDGAAPAAAADEGHAWLVTVPTVRVVNAVGSGDAVSAGISVALARGEAFEQALRLGIAAGSANATTLTAGDVDPVLVARLLADVRVEPREAATSASDAGA